jgi:predicted nucleic acid-binding protein
MMVIDASVAAKWFIVEPGAHAARELVKSGNAFIAPEFIVAEVLNVAWKRLIRNNLEWDQVAGVPDALPKLFTELWPTVWLAGRAFEIAAELRHAVYDCFYVALAEREGATLVTADRHLIGRLAGSRWEALCRPLVA